RLITQHPQAEIKCMTARSDAGKSYAEVYGNYKEIDERILTEDDLATVAEECDVVFIALPHGVAAKSVTEDILSKTKIIDLGADFRLKDADIYEKWYKVKHENREMLKGAVYGLCEVNRDIIKGKSLVANPGCYTTCSILTMYPLLKEGLVETKGMIIDAKSGVSGAGRNVLQQSLYCERNECVKPYGVANHRHTPEIEEQLGYAAGEDITLIFTPHLIPMNRGILSTCYAKLKEGFTYDDVKAAYEKYYAEEKFVRLTKRGVWPETRWVKGTNYLDIGFEIDERTNTVIAAGAIDNLVKGAAGQAVQNMNILFGLDEKTGLELVPVFPA
ncbi:MAG: N-acetyl-gamma-glutamyl-phosphate reductase, partial [Lachnospiraceae bacterium]|nr:N-acetyl-gamma-glutamyl-phosphate reductase [Lachnospiraceae bacterium]